MRIPTVGLDGAPNGYVLPIWNANEQPELRPDQVYLTVVAPHSQKGPHLHKIRRGLFCCIKGHVRIVQRVVPDGFLEYVYRTAFIGEDDQRLILVRPGDAACIYNDSAEEALLLNLPSPAWSKDQKDEWPVENWNS